MKRIASNESLNSVGSRVDTPTSQLRIRKKLELISEDGKFIVELGESYAN